MALTCLLLGFLLLGVCCGEFTVSVPKTIKVMRGSCMTIPCSFTIKTVHEQNLHDGCKGFWIRQHENPTSSKDMTAVIKGKDCTTTINNVNYTDRYFLRLDCDNFFEYNFNKNQTSVVVQDPPPPSLTLTPPTLSVQEGTVVNLKCSTPAPCWPHPPTLTWTPGLGNSQETLENNSDRSKVKTSVLTFTASRKHNGNEISCTAVHKKQDGTPDVTRQQSTNISVTFPPLILPFSDCNKTACQTRCGCYTVGNPAPSPYWVLDDKPIDPNGEFDICNKSLNRFTTRSIITFDQHQETDLSTLFCRSINSRGSATQRLSVPKTQGLMIPILVATNIFLLLLVICFVLFIIRVKWNARKQRSTPESFCLEENQRKEGSGQRFVSCAE